MIFEPRR